MPERPDDSIKETSADLYFYSGRFYTRSTGIWRESEIARIFVPAGTLASVVDSGTGLLAPISAWDFRSSQANFRTTGTNGFREVYLRDSNFDFDSGLGRLAWLIVDKIEPQFNHWVEHFTQNPANSPPDGMFFSGTGAMDDVSDEGGTIRLRTTTATNTVARCLGNKDSIKPSKELHFEIYIPRLNDGKTNIGIFAGLTDGNPIDPTQAGTESTFNWLGFYFNSSESGYWQFMARRLGTNVITAATGLSGRSIGVAVTQSTHTQLRFEFWPNGLGGFTSDTVKIYKNGVTKGSYSMGTSTLQTTIMRPYTAVKTTTGAQRSFDIDAIKAFWGETWKGTEV